MVSIPKNRRPNKITSKHWLCKIRKVQKFTKLKYWRSVSICQVQVDSVAREVGAVLDLLRSECQERLGHSHHVSDDPGVGADDLSCSTWRFRVLIMNPMVTVHNNQL